MLIKHSNLIETNKQIKNHKENVRTEWVRRNCQEKLRVISKWRWKRPADCRSTEEWKLQRSPHGPRAQEGAGTWPRRPRTGLAGAAPCVRAKPCLPWENYITKGVCKGCGGDWGYAGGLKVDLDSSEYTGYKYFYNKPGFRIKSRSCEDARFIHINFVLLAEFRYFEKVRYFYYNHE